MIKLFISVGLFFALVGCSSFDYKKPPAKLGKAEGALKYDVTKMVFGSEGTRDYSVTSTDRVWGGTNKQKQRAYGKVHYSFEKKGNTLYLYHKAYARTIDLRKYEPGDSIVGDVTEGVFVYQVLKTSEDEFITKIVDWSSRRRQYKGKEFYPQNWTEKSMTKWVDSTEKLSQARKDATYHWQIVEGGKKLVFEYAMPIERIK